MIAGISHNFTSDILIFQTPNNQINCEYISTANSFQSKAS